MHGKRDVDHAIAHPRRVRSGVDDVAPMRAPEAMDDDDIKYGKPGATISRESTAIWASFCVESLNGDALRLGLEIARAQAEFLNHFDRYHKK